MIFIEWTCVLAIDSVTSIVEDGLPTDIYNESSSSDSIDIACTSTTLYYYWKEEAACCCGYKILLTPAGGVILFASSITGWLLP